MSAVSSSKAKQANVLQLGLFSTIEFLGSFLSPSLPNTPLLLTTGTSTFLPLSFLRESGLFRCTNIIPEKYCREREAEGEGRETTRFVRILSFRIRSLMPLQLLLRRFPESGTLTRGSWDGRECIPTPTKKSTSSDRIQSPTKFDVSLAGPAAEQHVYIPTDLYAGTRKRPILNLRRRV